VQTVDAGGLLLAVDMHRMEDRAEF